MQVILNGSEMKRDLRLDFFCSDKNANKLTPPTRIMTACKVEYLNRILNNRYNIEDTLVVSSFISWKRYDSPYSVKHIKYFWKQHPKFYFWQLDSTGSDRLESFTILDLSSLNRFGRKWGAHSLWMFRDNTTIPWKTHQP